MEKSTLENNERHEESEGLWQGQYFRPKVDIVENENFLVVRADVPGVRIEDFEIDLKESVLSLAAQQRPLDERWKAIHLEFEEGHYFRKFRLGKQVDQSGIEATHKNGVLEIQIPLTRDPEPRKITITSS